MRFSCDSCQARYTIDDDKVRGKILRVRCRQCGNFILLEEQQEREVDESAQDDDTTRVVRVEDIRKDFETEPAPKKEPKFSSKFFTRSMKKLSSPPPLPPPPEKAEWFVIVQGEEIGPLTMGDLETRASNNRVLPRTYVWRDGMPNWERLQNVALLQGLLPLMPSVARRSNPPPTRTSGGIAPVNGAAARVEKPSESISEAIRKVDEELRLKAEAEAREKAEAEARAKADAEIKAKAEEEEREWAALVAQEKAEAEAREKAEAQAHTKAAPEGMAPAAEWATASGTTSAEEVTQLAPPSIETPAPAASAPAVSVPEMSPAPAGVLEELEALEPLPAEVTPVRWSLPPQEEQPTNQRADTDETPALILPPTHSEAPQASGPSVSVDLGDHAPHGKIDAPLDSGEAPLRAVMFDLPAESDSPQAVRPLGLAFEKTEVAPTDLSRAMNAAAANLQQQRRTSNVRTALILIVIGVLGLLYFGFLRKASHPAAPPPQPPRKSMTDWKAIDAKASLSPKENALLNGKQAPAPPTPAPNTAHRERPQPKPTEAPAPKHGSKAPSLTPQELKALLAMEADPKHPAPHQGPEIAKDDDSDKSDNVEEDDSAGIDPVLLQERVRRVQPGLSSCVTSALQRNPNLHVSKQYVTLTVQSTGAVSAVAFDRASFGETDLGQCVNRVLRTVVLPSFKGEPEKAQFPLTFSNG